MVTRLNDQADSFKDERALTPSSWSEKTSQTTRDKAYYALAMFPYPSWAWMHVGHVMNYTANDVIARFKRMNGRTVFNPIGWDAFWLPTENYALSLGKKAHEVTEENVENFKRQAKMMNWSYDWDNEINTSSPEYYKWTQWIFLKLLENGLVYRWKGYVNWCPNDKTVLANDQVVNGCCERCGTKIVQEVRPQWFISITKYADRLLADLDKIDWPEETKIAQREWIGKRVGFEADFSIVESGRNFPVFFDSAELANQCGKIILAPEHPLVAEYVSTNGDSVLDELLKSIVWMKMVDRKSSDVWEWKLNWKATNPLNGGAVDIFVSPSVMPDYAGGSLGVTDFVPLSSPDSPKSGIEKSEKEGTWRKKTIYKLRDWSVSRQRYWGAPIPIWYDEKGNPNPVDEDELPVTLPLNLDDYRPTGKSPLENHPTFQKYVRDGREYKRECDTLDTFMCSSFYFVRFPDNRNVRELIAPEAVREYLPVDFYIGGREHSVWHLLYARFVYKFLFDIGVVPTDEPFRKLVHQGMVLAEDGRKMSKRWGNVVNPDEVCQKYGSDALRTYVMFMGPIEDSKNWDEKSLQGIVKFLKRCKKLEWKVRETGDDVDVRSALNEAISGITGDIERMRLNTAISKIMILLNRLEKKESVSTGSLKIFAQLLSPFAPSAAQELWISSNESGEVSSSNWPKQTVLENESEKKVTIGVQIDWKRRWEISVSSDCSQESAIGLARSVPEISKYLEENRIWRIIYVPGKILNITLLG